MSKKDPTKTELHIDGRASDSLTPREAAQILGVSEATIRNWLKLGKLAAISSSPILLKRADVLALHRELEKGTRLTSRRNKSRAAANYIPVSYIDSKSPNYRVIRELLEILSETSVNESAVLSFYAKELMASRGIPDDVAKELVRDLECSNGDKPSSGTSCSEDSVGMPSDTGRSASIPSVSLPALTYVPGEDTLGMLYISLRKMREKKSTGSYYTPYHVVDLLIEDLLKQTPDGTEGLGSWTTFSAAASALPANAPQPAICDPACGTGNFLIRLPAEVPLEAIHGRDIDPNAVAIARINLALKYGIKDSHQLNTITQKISVMDFLSESVSETIYIGNPPWGYSFSPKECTAISKRYKCCTGSAKPESFALFIEKALSDLAPGGQLSFVLPESLLESGLHSTIRELILKEGTVTSLSYLGDVFDKVQCPGIILTVRKKDPSAQAAYDDAVRVSVYDKNARSGQITCEDSGIRSFTASADRLSKASFHLLCDDEEYAILEKIRAVPHFTLKGQADFALGIVTGNNKELLRSAVDITEKEPLTPSPGTMEPIIKGSNISPFRISKAENYIEYKPESFQQCAPTALYRAKEKLFYRFIATRPVVARDCSGLLSLNSANIIVPHVPGYSAAYIMAVLNSSVIGFYYSKTFRSLKVLRSSLESLPIPICDRETRDEIEALVYELESGESSENTEKMLDSKVLECYGITNDLKWRF